MMENDIRFRAIGRIEKLPSAVIQSIRHVEEETSENRTMVLNIALNYGGRSEIIDAIQKFIEDVQIGKKSFKDLNETEFSNYLYTEGNIDPDLMIRTSGEERISNFLLWQLAYTELYFSKTLWPDFRRKDLLLAILDFQRRERRFGKIAPEIPQESTQAKR
jgi:undecaprenyl diphosphate synthase